MIIIGIWSTLADFRHDDILDVVCFVLTGLAGLRPFVVTLFFLLACPTELNRLSNLPLITQCCILIRYFQVNICVP